MSQIYTHLLAKDNDDTITFTATLQTIDRRSLLTQTILLFSYIVHIVKI